MRRPPSPPKPVSSGYGLLWIGMASAAAVSVLVVVGFEAYGARATLAFIDQIHPGFTLLRFAAIVLAIGGWPRWARLIGDRHGLNLAQRQALLEARWRIAGWLTFFELAIVQGGVDELFKLLTV